MKINYVSLCSGYGAECLALKRLQRDYPGFTFECVAWSEIEPSACKAHDALHPEYKGRNLGDMTTCDYSVVTHPVEMLFYSTPCQSVSQAGRGTGMDKDNDSAASSLIWHTERAIRELNPRICVLENVRGMVCKNHKHNFDEWCRVLESYGYKNYWQILNAKDYGVAQNRERVFMVSIKGEHKPYNFPEPFVQRKCVEDYMEDNVEESYFIEQYRITPAVLSNIFDQPDVLAQLEALYHEEWKEANSV